MRLRLILFVLSLLAFLSTSTGGFFYYASLKEAEFEAVDREAASRVAMIQRNLTAHLTENYKPVKTLAGMVELRNALLHVDEATLQKANAILDHFKQTLEADVCYLMNTRGDTIASSNRNDPDSFLGMNFAFRPYFYEAFQKAPATYLAVGVISGKRGVYCSYPVVEEGTKTPIGLAVIKASIELIERKLALSEEELVVVTAPSGIIFISNREGWLFKAGWELSAEESQAIITSRQFGRKSWNWIGLNLKNTPYTVDRQGNTFRIYTKAIDYYPGWTLHYLKSLASIEKNVSDPLIRITGRIILSLCFLIGLSAFFLYRKASKEILKRKTVEKALRKSEEALKQAQVELSQYAENLERLVRKRTGQITSFIKYTPAVIYIMVKNGRYSLVNNRFEELFGVRSETVRGRTHHEILPEKVADQFRRHDRKVLRENRPYQVTERISQADGMHTYLAVKFPIYDDTGTVSGLCSIATDVTALNKAQEQLRRLSASIMDNQEKERTAIARELHDELGQVLTALRMDAVWMIDHLKNSDPKAALRALTMCHLIDKNIEDVRGMAIRLRPGVLDDLGLVDALEWYTTDFEKRCGITCVFKHHQVPAVNNTLATAAYRITQEALTNVARHSGANSVEVSLRAPKGSLMLTVSDDGCGFQDRQLSESECLGIAGMRERAALVGGVLQIKSQPDKGTQVNFTVPLENPPRRSH